MERRPRSICRRSARPPFHRATVPRVETPRQEEDRLLRHRESEGTAGTLQANGFTKRHNSILMGAQAFPQRGARWAKLIQDQLKIPMYFFG